MGIFPNNANRNANFLAKTLFGAAQATIVRKYRLTHQILFSAVDELSFVCIDSRLVLHLDVEGYCRSAELQNMLKSRTL